MRLAIAIILATAASLGSASFCPLPAHAQGGRLQSLVCEESSSTFLRGPAAQTKTTPLDYNDVAAGDFQQRYWVNADHWDQTNGPLFMFVGGEGPASAPGGWAVELAKTFSGAIATLEHRFYGESLPAGGPQVALALDKIQYLTVAAALQDLNEGIDHVIQQLGADPSIPVVLIGGSYPGALVGWHRVAYPSKTVAGIASSGVVHSILEYTAFDQAVAQALPADCAAVVRATTAAFDAADQAGGAAATAARALFGSPATMSVPDFAYMLADSAAMAVQYGTKDQLCSALKPSADPNVLMSQFATFTKAHFGAGFGANCFYDTDCLINRPADWQPTSRSWRFQKCSEMAWLQTAPTTGSLRSASLTIEALKQQCQDIFGMGSPTVDAINTAYGGVKPSTSWVFYSQGSDDPWKPAGINQTLSNTLREFTANCDGCGHCKDLHTPSSSDPTVIRHQRQLEVAFLDDVLRLHRQRA